jgi:hypothetical protein
VNGVMRKRSLSIIIFLMSLGCIQCSFFRPSKPLVNIAGTVVSLRPPENFVPAPHVTGFWNQEIKATIMVAEIPRTFAIASEEIVKGDTLKEGLKVLSKEKIEVDGRVGVLYQLNRKNMFNNFNQWMLVLANSDYTTAISGTYQAKDENKLSLQIKEALLTTQIEDDESRLFRSLPFEINIEKPTLKLAKVLAGPSIVYTADGVWSDSSMFSNSFYIGPSYPLKSAIADQEKFAMENFSRVCSTCEMDSSSLSEVTINDLKGFELWGYTKNTHKLKYQVILYDSTQYYLAVGTAMKDHDENLQLFRVISRTFKRKDLVDSLVKEQKKIAMYETI